MVMGGEVWKYVSMVVLCLTPLIGNNGQALPNFEQFAPVTGVSRSETCHAVAEFLSLSMCNEISVLEGFRLVSLQAVHLGFDGET